MFKSDKDKKKEPEIIPVDASKLIWTVRLKEAARRSDPNYWCVPLPIKKAIDYIESQGTNFAYFSYSYDRKVLKFRRNL
jgi:hypothetical protein